MSGFTADWLALRAGADAGARDTSLAARLGAHLKGRGSVRVLDLGAGTGANLRATAALIGPPQHWLLADHDAALLARAEPAANTTIERREVDLAGDLSSLFDPHPDLVTASALLDLCGAAWVDRLAEQVTAKGAALYAVLSYDGREAWRPPHALDAEVLAAFHADQRRDKGLGPALGPEAHGHLAGSLRGHGYQVFEGPSDWNLARPGDAALIAALADASAAAVEDAIGAGRAGEWRAARLAAHRVTIGHRDLLALPPS
ncbi:MAG: SAM-dependent methyltransferase [Alphaproteobacteria bacterium]